MKTSMVEKIKNVLACGTCLVSVVIMFDEIVQWLMYV